MRFQTLADWLAWQETLHPSRIDLRLERVGTVWDALGLGPLRCPVITVGGTNGKGSVVAYLETIYRAAGYRACAYTSPHLLRYNERIRIDGADADDSAICDAFAQIDAVRRAAQLTYFEFGTLAALVLFAHAAPDVVLLEVGLGGRLDAVNILDADVAVVTRIGLDHQAWLGDTLEQIAFEKAGIFRPGRPAVIGQSDAPPRLRQQAVDIGATPLQLGREFRWRMGVGDWQWQGPNGAQRGALPPPALRGRHQYDNAATAICAVECLGQRLPVDTGALRRGLHRVQVPGRFTVLSARPSWVLDVAHNPDAARALAESLAALGCSGEHHALIGVSADKDAAGIAGALSAWVGTWHAVPAPGARGMPVDVLAAAIAQGDPGSRIEAYESLDAAMRGLMGMVRPDDCVVVMGSFTTVEAALRNPEIGPV